ncbi:hypothetical protein ACQUY5_29240 [Bacillus cereus]|uniref:hypothetical protein n=1 Tax=Bacillus cereus TaxID=1396 RepID=UPI003D16328B
MLKESKQSIYDNYNRVWFSNPTVRALGYNKDRYCTGIATTPKELIPLLNDKECTGVVFLTSVVNFEEYDVNTGQRVETDTFYNGERFKGLSYVEYIQTLSKIGFDLDKEEDIENCEKQLIENKLFLESLINYGFEKNIDVESSEFKVHENVTNKLKSVYLIRGNLTFCITAEQLAIPVGIDSFIIVHNAYRDVDFKFIVDTLSKGLVVKRKELEQKLLQSLSTN